MLSTCIVKLPLDAVAHARTMIGAYYGAKCSHVGVCGICTRETNVSIYIHALNIEVCDNCNVKNWDWGRQPSVSAVNEYLHDHYTNLPELRTVARRALVALRLAGGKHTISHAASTRKECGICTRACGPPTHTYDGGLNICDKCSAEAGATISDLCHWVFVTSDACASLIIPEDISSAIYTIALELATLEAIL